jgi:amino acid adenylation domain-containing protein
MELLSSQSVVKVPEGFIPIPVEELEHTVVEYFEQIVEKFPEKPAVIDRKSEITYRDLNSSSNQCARVILNILGDVHDEPVLILCGHSISSLVVILGILKSGNIYVALDVSQPIERLNAILEDSQSRLIITSGQNMDLAQNLALSGVQIFNLDTLDSALSKENLPLRLNSRNLAVIFYTSGSTGIPKGVLLDHRALMARVAEKINTDKIHSQDRLLLPFPAGFGWSTQPVFGAFLTGATLYVRSYNEMTLKELSDWLDTNKISHLPGSPSFLRQFLSSLPVDGRKLFPHLRTFIAGGETLHPQDVTAWQKHFSDNCVLLYGYSSTEAGPIVKTFFSIDSTVNEVVLHLNYLYDPIKLYILDEDDKPVGEGVVGQIAYRSPAMLRGYWRRLGLNSQKFISDPEDPSLQIFLSSDMGKLIADGSLEFLGRKDTMLKIRGYRIDTVEVETALYKHPSIENAFVTSWAEAGSMNDPRLIAYVSFKENYTLSEGDMRKFMVENLPDYMVPTKIILLKEFPINPNGKIDRKALPALGSSRPDINTPYAPPQTDLEKKIGEIWRNVLNIDTVGLNDDFFELGGSSLIALQMIMQVEKLIKKTISPAFFQQATILNLIKELDISESNGTNEDSRYPSTNLKDEQKQIQINMPRPTRKRSATWREKAHHTRKVIRVLPYLHVLNKPFPEGYDLLIKAGSNTSLNRLLYVDKYFLMQKFLKSIGSSKNSIKPLMDLSIKGNILIKLLMHTTEYDKPDKMDEYLKRSTHLFWRSLDDLIHNSPIEKFYKYFSVEGLEFLDKARKNPHGVILLTYHSSLGRFATPSLSRQLGGQQIITISSVSARRRKSNWVSDHENMSSDVTTSALSTSEALRGQHMLEEGKTIQLVGDEKLNNLGKSILLGDRMYMLKTGFADLSLNTSATIIPLYNTLLKDGHIHTIIKEEFDPGKGDRETRIQNLVTQYGKFINSAWLASPESLTWNRLQIHLSKPSIGHSTF